jgi:hypothetical protein
LAIKDDDIRGPIQTDKVIHRQTLAKGDRPEVDSALLEFFNQLYDATGYPRQKGLFHFPPDPPHL